MREWDLVAWFFDDPFFNRYFARLLSLFLSFWNSKLSLPLSIDWITALCSCDLSAALAQDRHQESKKINTGTEQVSNCIVASIDLGPLTVPCVGIEILWVPRWKRRWQRNAEFIYCFIKWFQLFLQVSIVSIKQQHQQRQLIRQQQQHRHHHAEE